jgi:hypothetical protein
MIVCRLGASVSFLTPRPSSAKPLQEFAGFADFILPERFSAQAARSGLYSAPKMLARSGSSAGMEFTVRSYAIIG